MWWLDALKRIEKIIRENAFEQKKNKPRLKFNSGLALIGLRTTGPWFSFCISNMSIVGWRITSSWVEHVDAGVLFCRAQFGKKI